MFTTILNYKAFKEGNYEDKTIYVDLVFMYSNVKKA